MTEQKEKELPVQEFPVLKIRAYEKEECRKRVVVSVKVAAVKYPMPKRITLRIKLKDGSEKIVKGSFVSMYKDYAYYLLQSAHARELVPLFDQIQKVRLTTRRRRNEPRR
jgi:hypothetical protein